MTISIGASFSTNRLTLQPFAYEGEARTGLTARTFQMTGLLTAVEWQNLIGTYNTWRDLRIQDADTLQSATVGTTINVTITSANGISISNLACWFAEPPSGDQTGAYISATVVMVDAAQALQVLLRDVEKAKDKDLPSLGTITFGSGGSAVTITLTKPMDTRQDGPSVALTATGVSYVTGALTAHKTRQVEGFISSGTYANLLAWYDTTIAAIPMATSWFPISPPTATAEVMVSSGVKSTRYNVTITVLQIL
jgi:hypothetical protein